MVGIYKITSPSGKVYIGQSWDIQNRFREYRSIRRGAQPKLDSSLLKYGHDQHTFEIIHQLPVDVSQEVLNRYEIFYWQQYKDCGFNTMNIKEPGIGGKHSEESKSKMSKIKKGVKKPLRTKEHCNNIAKAKLNHVVSKETKEKIKQKLFGRKQSEETKVRRLETRKMNGHLKALSERMKKPMLHVESGIKYSSRTEAAEAFGYGLSVMKRKIKEGAFIYLNNFNQII